MNAARRAHGREILERIAARHRCERTARTFHDRQKCGDVPIAQIRIDHDVGAARSNGKITKAVAEGTVELDGVDQLLNALVALLFPCRPVARCKKRCLGQLSAVTHMKRTNQGHGAVVVVKRSTRKGTHRTHACSRMTDGRENRPETRSVVAFERNQRAEKKTVGDKAAGAVNRIQYPAIPNPVNFLAFLDAELFAEDSVLREPLTNHLAHDGFGLFVSLRHGRAVVLVIDFNAAQEAGRNLSKGCVEKLKKKRRKTFEFGRRCRRAVAIGGHSGTPRRIAIYCFKS